MVLIESMVKKRLNIIVTSASLQVQQSLDGVMEYLLNNTPLNWLVGPFAPQLTEKTERDVPMEQDGPNN